MIRIIKILFLSLCITGCTSGYKSTPESTAYQFYLQYLTAFASFDVAQPANSQMDEESTLIRTYVAKETIGQLKTVQSIEEQEILESDYFTYVQDYSADWIPALKIGASHPSPGGVTVPVSIGVDNTEHIELSVFMRHERGAWKIYRVRDETHGYEQPIFDAGRISAAFAHAKALPPLK